MRFDQLARVLSAMALVGLISVAGTSCGGGGGNGGNGTSSGAVVLGISIPGVAGGNNFVRADGTSTLVPNVFLNGRLVITLGGNVDPSSLPPAGQAVAGPVEIISLTSNTPARGVFSVNPLNPAQVIFDAFPPTSTIPGQGCVAGFNGTETYRISVTAAGPAGAGNVLTVGGNPLSTGAAGTFSTINCDPLNPSPSFTDSNGVDPQVIAQSPAPGSNMNVGAIPGFPTSTIITIDVDESVDPSSVNASNLVLVNKTINTTMDVPVGGSVSLMQFGSVPGNPSIARIVYATSQPLPDGHTFEFVFLGVTDLAGKPLNAPTVGTAFSTIDENNNVPVAFVEDFSTTNNRGSLTQSIVWPGTVAGDPNSGRVSSIFPIAILGNGLDGVGSFPTSMTINADSQLTPGDPNAAPAVYNFTTLSLGNPGGAPVTLNFTSTTNVSPGAANFPVHFRSQTDINVRNSATLLFEGRKQTINGGPPNVGSVVSITGGWGGPGGGRGGEASPLNDPNIANLKGDPGEGAHVDANDTTKPGGMIGNTGDDSVSPPTGLFNSFYGGGGAGFSGLNLSPAPNFGPSGGGGGTASGFAGYGGMPPAGNTNITFTNSTNGESQNGSDGAGLGAPNGGVRGQVMAAMMSPLIAPVGGSGGGASGDRGNGGVVSTFRTGAAGGGGGGAVRLSAGGTVTFGFLSTISVKGGTGSDAMGPFVAGGAGGSGGSILAQTFGTLVLNASAAFDASGGPGGVDLTPINPVPVLNGDGGQGGDGLIQLEDGTANFVSTSLGFITVRGELFTQIFPLTGTITDMARSIPIDTGSNGTDYTAASATSMTGTNAMSTVDVQVFGIAEDPNTAGQPATTTMSVNGTILMVGPLPLSQFDQLDGFRFFIFEITTSYPSPPSVSATDVLPFVDDITINYSN